MIYFIIYELHYKVISDFSSSYFIKFMTPELVTLVVFVNLYERFKERNLFKKLPYFFSIRLNQEIPIFSHSDAGIIKEIIKRQKKSASHHVKGKNKPKN